MLDYEGLARASPNLKERMRDSTLQERLCQPDEGVHDAVPQRSDRGDGVELRCSRSIACGRRVKRRSMQFLELLPVVKRYIDDMTADDIRERWDDDDRRAVNQRRIDYETDAVFDLVQKVGFALDEPDSQTLELIRRMFSYTGGKTVGISMVRKRLATWKTPGKQNVYAFHNG